jgi:uracil-DNA glycosylase
MAALPEQLQGGALRGGGGDHPLQVLREEVAHCRACPRLVDWREKVAREKRAAYRDEEYWGRPVPGFGDPAARLLIVGLAPAAHGANRTGRMFTGDHSGLYLFRALHRAGFATQAESLHRNDGLELVNAWLTAALRCAPPENRPRPEERRNCRPFLEREVEWFLPRIRCVTVLGQYAFDHTLRILRDRGLPVPSPKPPCGHGTEARIEGTGLEEEGITLLSSYHPSQQNTFTGTLTEEAFDRVWARAREIVDQGG